MKLGLVFAGGGGKGGYEIGVWKYLSEIGLDKKISVISGTSVGGLNAALVTSTDCEVAEYIWSYEIDDKILDKQSSTRKKGAFFSRFGLIDIIDRYVNFDKMKTSGKEVYVTCFNMDKLETESFNLNKYDTSNIKTLLCATSAIPVVFQNEKLEEYNYIDGGIKVPFSPLIQENCTHAIIVMLDDTYIDYSGYDIKTLIIHPSIGLGSFFSGTLDFSLERSRERIKIGYNDCKNKSLELRCFSEEIMIEEDIVETLNKINEMNDTSVLLETLKKLVIDPSAFGQIQCNMNKEMGTRGGKIWWNNKAVFGGLKFQQNKITKHLRLLDSMNNRRAWGDYLKMIDICKQYLMREAKKNIQKKNVNDFSVEERLVKLNDLHNKGLITESELKKMKDEILAEV